MGRGDFQSASHHLELARRLNPAPFIAVWPLASLAELAIWQGRHDDARAAVDEGMGVLEQLQAGQDEPDPEFKRLGMSSGCWGSGRRPTAPSWPGRSGPPPVSTRPASGLNGWSAW